MHYTKIIFEQLRLVHFPILKYHLWKQREIKFFDNEGSAKRKNWVKKLVKDGRISEIPPIGYVGNECYGTALDNMEKVYKCLTNSSTLIKEMAKIYGDGNIELAYKKEITRRLSEFYYINSYLAEEEAKLGTDERLLFTAYRYEQYLKLIRENGAFYRDHEKIDIANSLKVFDYAYYLFRKVEVWFLQLGMMAFHCVRLITPGKDGSQVKEYKYAIPIRNPDYQFKFKTRPVDFLLDGNNIRKDNTIFILLNPAITKDNLHEIKSKNLNMVDCSKRFMASPGFDRKETIHILRRILPYIAKHVFIGLFENSFVLEVNTILLDAFFKWTSILQGISIKHFITLNDEGIDHIGRNILLNKTGAKTWYYAHSGSLGYIIVPTDSNIRKSRHWLWSFLYYDYYVSWNDRMIEYYKLHPQRIKNYVSIGCLWSQPIADILEGRIASSLEKKIFTNFDRDKYKTLAFFDSSYLPNSVSPLEDGIVFYQCILRLTEEFPDMLVIVKEKKTEEKVLGLYERFGGNIDIFYKYYKPALDELRQHPRCHVTGYTGDPSEVIAMSDLTVTYAFSSSTLEALGARKKATFFDPGNRWRGYYYDRIPNFVAHSYDELKTLVHYWLYEVTDKDFEDFLNTYVKDEIDPYLDGKALTRLRKLFRE